MKRGVKITIWILAVLAVCAGVGGFVFGRYYIDNKKPNFSEEYVLYVRPEMTAGQVLDSCIITIPIRFFVRKG